MPIVTLLTDFGLHDAFVGCLRGVILARCPAATVVDLCHAIRPFDILGASFLLQSALPCFGPGTIHVVVVDPGVGGERRPLLAEIDGHVFVAPDNGVLSYPLQAAHRTRLRHLTAPEFWRLPVSRSFHGRDIFAPVAGHLAAGVGADRFGPPLHDPVRLALPQVRRESDRVHGQVIWIDHFGNCVTTIPGAEVETLAGASAAVAGERIPVVDSFGSVPDGSCGALVGSTGHLELFVNRGDFARSRQVRVGDEVALEGATGQNGPPMRS
jgi:S-adenosyl-L-methionine hydrolase (adenosine-forming)